MLGEVKWYSPDRGYGFITSGKKDYFVSCSDILKGSKEGKYKYLKANEIVSFSPGTRSRGLVAEEVEVQKCRV